jgi:Family of unknown function (DUF6491)
MRAAWCDWSCRCDEVWRVRHNRRMSVKRIKLSVLFLSGCSVSLLMHNAAAADDPVPPPASTAAAPAAGVEAQIPFASQTIWRWRVVDNNTVLIQDRGRRWYKATLWGNCINLSFAQTLSFVSNPNGGFDKFSSIRFGGQRCPLRSLVVTTAPPKKSVHPDPAASPKTQTGATPI